jgi:hypothetical protein
MLKARWKVVLPAPIHVATTMELYLQEHAADGAKLAEGDVFNVTKAISYEFKTQGFDCHLELDIDVVSNPLSVKHHWHGAQRATLTLSAANFSPEDVNGDRLPKTNEAFVRAAYEILNRLICYSRYKLGHPFMRPINISNVESAEWLDASNTVVQTEGECTVVGFFPGIPNTPRSLGSQYLTPGLTTSICTALSSGGEASIQEELLAFARDSIYEGHSLKAVLLMAVAAEVAIKTTFFRQDSLASIAFDYLEEKRKVEVTAIELIDKVAKRVGGASFKENDAEAFRDIDYLFRCRNKVAHRAMAQYKDDEGQLHLADEAKLYRWWQSVERLLRWLPRLIV